MNNQTSDGNLFADIPLKIPNEGVNILVQNEIVRIERIVSNGHASPAGFWYDQEEHEWILLLSGKAKLQFDGGDSINLIPGDHQLIPAHKKHRVEWTTPDEPTIWLAIFWT